MEGQKVKLMCSYGGKIQLRPHDHQLTYVGGDTKILTVDRNMTYCDMSAKLKDMCSCNTELCIKYQLPGEDLDALVSLVDNDDVEQMMFEYDRMQKASTKPARLRLFLFYPTKLPDSPPLVNPDFLFGFDKDYLPNPNPKTEDLLLQLQIPDNSVTKNQENGCGKNSLARENHVNGGVYYNGNGVQMVYGVPVMMTGGGYHNITGFGQYMEQHQPVYNFVPAAATTVTSVMVPKEQKIMASTAP